MISVEDDPLSDIRARESVGVVIQAGKVVKGGE
jgi:hypothetical protein